MLRRLVVCGFVLVGCGKDNDSTQSTGTASASTKPAIPTPPKLTTAPPDLPQRYAEDTPEVLAKFDSICDSGYGPACFDSGMRRAKGMGTKNDRPAATEWLEKGCNLDDLESCSLLGSFYGMGDEGVKQNKPRAVELHTKACSGTVPISCRLLAGYYMRGEIVKRDPAKAMALLDQACKANDPPACRQAEQHRKDGTDH